MNDEQTYEHIFDEIDRRLSIINPDVPQRMSHCFMTGKQCIFADQLARLGREVFVAMPFRRNFDAFYQWCLRPYLVHVLRGIPEELICRADQYRDIGNVMCEKVCRRIQASRLFVVDITLDNPNVFYELGLAVGLNKPLLVFCEGSAFEKSARKRLLRGLGIDNENKLVRYPNLGHIATEEHKILERVTKVKLPPKRYDMSICSLIVPTAPFPDANDMPVDFAAAIDAAVRVSVERILQRGLKRNEGGKTDGPSGDSPEQKLADAVKALSKEEQDTLKRLLRQPLYDGIANEPNRNPHSYDEVSRRVRSSFATIIDLASEDILSYFWLGFCHAAGINVIPIYRNTAPARPRTVSASDAPAASPGPKPTPDGSGEDGRQSVLAFDIRALWYMDYNTADPNEMATMLEAVLEELMIKDIMTQQRRAFWGRLAKSGKLHIYTGAIHIPGLNREAVGDWDLRTVSELVRYLSSADEPIVPKLVRPIYAHETIKSKLKKEDGSGKGTDRRARSSPVAEDEYLGVYRELIEEELAHKNCLVVASADVNPLTEMLLSAAYKDLSEPEKQPNPFPSEKVDDDQCDRHVVIALKEEGKQEEGKKEESLYGESEYKRFFSKVSRRIKKGNRGLLIDKEICQREYFSQDQPFKKFEVLGHLMIMKNPFARKRKDGDQSLPAASVKQEGPGDNIIVILNGVSGPGTFGLAEVLTGGEQPEQKEARHKIRDAETILGRINRAWDQAMNDVAESAERRERKKSSTKESRFIGVEAFFEVTIERGDTIREATDASRRASGTGPASEEKRRNTKGKVEDKFSDKRQVTKWSLLDEHNITNPRALIAEIRQEEKSDEMLKDGDAAARNPSGTHLPLARARASKARRGGSGRTASARR